MSGYNMLVDAGVAHVIRCEAYRAWSSLRRFGFDRSDVRQELTISCLTGFDRYDPTRSSPATFAARRCRQRTLQLIEPVRAAKRNCGDIPQSLSAPVGDAHGATVNVGDLISDDEVAIKVGRRSRPELELTNLRIDVEQVLRGLPANLVEVARQLMDGESIVVAARRLGVSRATLHRRVVQLRRVFQEAGLGAYACRVEAA